MGVHKIITVALVLSVFLSQRTTAQTAPCVSLTLPSLWNFRVPATVSDPASGTVIMRVQVSKSGLIHDIEIFSGPSALATRLQLNFEKRWEYKPADWVESSLSPDRYTFLSVTVQKGSAPHDCGGRARAYREMASTLLHTGRVPEVRSDEIAIAWILSSRLSPQIPRIVPTDSHSCYVSGDATFSVKRR